MDKKKQIKKVDNKSSKKTEKKQCLFCGLWVGKYYLKTHISKIHPNEDNKYKVPEDVTVDKVQLELDTTLLIDDMEKLGLEINMFESSPKIKHKSNIKNKSKNKSSKKSNQKGLKKTEQQSNKLETKNVLEKDVQLKLEKKTGGKHHYTPAGIIDIFLPDKATIIEIKHWKGWHHAIGQLMVYSYYYPNFMKQIHFFGDIPSDEKRIVILTICAHHKIAVTWEK